MLRNNDCQTAEELYVMTREEDEKQKITIPVICYLLCSANNQFFEAVLHIFIDKSRTISLEMQEEIQNFSENFFHIA